MTQCTEKRCIFNKNGICEGDAVIKFESPDKDIAHIECSFELEDEE